MEVDKDWSGLLTAWKCLHNNKNIYVAQWERLTNLTSLQDAIIFAFKWLQKMLKFSVL
jgi:hypothetical protein